MDLKKLSRRLLEKQIESAKKKLDPAQSSKHTKEEIEKYLSELEAEMARRLKEGS